MAKARKPAKAPTFDESILDELLGGRTTGEELDELFRQMTKSLMERVLHGELTHHLGYKAGEPVDIATKEYLLAMVSAGDISTTTPA